jgi:hypothetical protein
MDCVWPDGKVPYFPPCGRCGQPRQLEMQLMSPLWHVFEQSIHWYGDTLPPHIDASVLQHPHWDWQTVAVATCSASCQQQSESFVVAEEAVAGFNLTTGSSPKDSLLSQFESLHKSGCLTAVPH